MRNEAEQVFARWLGSLVPHTARAYRDGWKRVERITGRSDIGAWALEDESGTQKVLQSAIGGAPSAGYRNRLRAGFRSYLLFAKSAGLIEWEWTSAYEHVTPTRDSHGPSLDVVRRLFRHTVSATDITANRDAALFALVIHLTLRRAEISGLDRCDWDGEHGRLRAVRKGSVVCWMQIPTDTSRLLHTWTQQRGEQEGPLFYSQRSRNDLSSKRLSCRGIARALKRRCREIGVPEMTTTQLRHVAITYSGLTDGIYGLHLYSGHRSTNNALRYVDAFPDPIAPIDRRRTLTEVFS